MRCKVMVQAQNLAAVRRMEEYLSQKVEKTAFDLTDLVAVFTQRDNGSWLAVFNVEEPSDLPGFSEAVSFEQLLQDKRDLSVEYNGILITFDALGLIRPD